MKKIPGSLYSQILSLEVEANKDNPDLVHVPDYLYDQLYNFVLLDWLGGGLNDEQRDLFNALLDGYYDRPTDNPA